MKKAAIVNIALWKSFPYPK